MIFEATKWLQCCHTSHSHRRLSTYRFTLSGFYTRSLSLLNSHSAHLLHPFSPASQLPLPLASLCLFPSFGTRVPKRPCPFHETTHLKRPNDTLLYPTMPRLSPLCLRFGRYLRPFAHDSTYIYRVGVKIWVKVRTVKRIPGWIRRYRYAIKEILTRAYMIMTEFDK